MKKLLFAAVAFAALVSVLYFYDAGLMPGAGGDKGELRSKTIRFFECLKFKEFVEAADYHNEEDRQDADIPRMIENLFRIPPEYLDIQDISLMFVEIDSSGVLAKTKTRCHAKELNTGAENDHEVILYWKKEREEWFLKLKSSLERF